MDMGNKEAIITVTNNWSPPRIQIFYKYGKQSIVHNWQKGIVNDDYYLKN